jgi:hypothetical protein
MTQNWETAKKILFDKLQFTYPERTFKLQKKPLEHPTLQNIKIFLLLWIIFARVSDPDPYWTRIQSGQWIRIRIRNPDPDPGGQK